MSERASKIRLAAMNLLARREHSRRELERKLAGRFPDDGETFDAVLGSLTEQGLQSDSRFAESYCRSRISRGYGPQRIRYELRDKGVDDIQADTALKALGVDWFAQALTTLQKKFGDLPPADVKEKAKRQRFLQYRGFNSDEIRHAIETAGIHHLE